jgi:DNA-binding transcriptional regulator YiaG
MKSESDLINAEKSGKGRETGHPDYCRLVHDLRERIGLTQEKFAARLGVTFPTINRWENGHSKPSPLALRQVEALLRELGKNGEDLMAHYFPEG